VDFLGMALCWSRSYGRLALRNGCNLMEHPFEDAVMDRVYTSAIIRPVLKLPSTIEFLKDLLGGYARI
jgi:hypothetical protein